jgi:hypothetical protein
MNWFTSPREREGQATWKDIMDSLSSIGNVESTYGLKRRSEADVSRTFDPARSNIATRRAQDRSAARERVGGNNAMPSSVLGPIDQKYATAFGDLESNAAEKGLDVARGDEQFLANFMKNGRMDAAQQYLNTLSNASTFDDILAGAGTAAKFLNPFGGAASMAPNTVMGAGGDTMMQGVTPENTGFMDGLWKAMQARLRGGR